jgi:hypothetical protein
MGIKTEVLENEGGFTLDEDQQREKLPGLIYAAYVYGLEYHYPNRIRAVLMNPIDIDRLAEGAINPEQLEAIVKDGEYDGGHFKVKIIEDRTLPRLTVDSVPVVTPLWSIKED